jgi:hypothetical protein
VISDRMIEPFNSCQMAACEVSQIVASIVSAYHSGLDVFRKVKCKKKGKSSKTDKKTEQEEALLQMSLSHRPRDIRTAYESKVAVHKERFEIGDTIAHSSLAHTLLVLNSGLISILNSTLSNDVAKRRQSQRSLLNLSEVAAAQALEALALLDARLRTYQPRILKSTMLPTDEPQKKRRTHSKTPSKSIADIKIDPKVKSRAEKNLVSRGGWVRPPIASRAKSGSYDVTVASSRNSSTTKLADHKRCKSMASGNASPPEDRSSKGSPRPGHRRTESSPAIPSQPIAELPSETRPQQRHHSSEHHRLPREPSMIIVPSDFFESQLELSIQRPPTVPLHSRPSMSTTPPTVTQPRPISVATFLSASTKIGEIPSRPDAELRPMPYTIPPPLNIEDVSPKKRRGLRFWKKSEPVVQAVVY